MHEDSSTRFPRGDSGSTFETPSGRFIISPAEAAPGIAQRFERGDVVAKRYEVRRELGVGGMCTVYLVSDRVSDDRTVALKLISGETNPLRIETLRNEFRILSHFNHENLIRVYDFGVLAAGLGFYYTADYIEGMELHRAVEGASEDKLIDFIVQVCRGLEYVHARGYIHYDIKPANILVTDDGTIKLTDFGLSALADRALGKRIRGTPAYTSPEIITNAAVDARTDLYSLGITLYEITTGATPFRGRGLNDLFRKHVTELPAPPGSVKPDIPEYLEKIILRLLAKNPAERFDGASAIINELARARGVEIEIRHETSAEGYLRNPPLIGRDREMQTLYSALDNLSEGTAAHITLEGPAGIGRSRILQEIKFESQLRGYATAMVSADDSELFTTLAVELAAHPEVSLPASLRDAGADALEAGLSPSTLPDDAARVLAIAEQVPTVVCIDDAQEVTPKILSALSRLSRFIETSTAPALFLLTTWREGEDVDPGVFTTASRLRLSPISDEETGEIASRMFGSIAPPEMFVANLVETTSGIPLAVVETIRMLVSTGEIAIVEGKWHFRGGPEPFEIAPSLEDFYQKQAKTLRGLEHKLAYNIALIERAVTMTEISGLHDEAPEKIAAALSQLEKREIIRRREGKIEILNRGIRDAVIATRTSETRRQRHAQIAKRFVRIRGRNITKLEIARHYLLSNQKTKGIRYGLTAIKSGEIKKNRSTDISFLHHLSKAAKNETQAVRAKILYALADASARDADPSVTLSMIDEYLETVPRTESREHRAKMERYRAECYGLLKNHEKADVAWKRALELAKPGSDTHLGVLLSYVKVLEFRGRLEDCEELLLDAVAKFADRESHGRVRVLVSLVRLSLSRGMIKKVGEYIRQVQELARRLNIEEDEEIENLPGALHLIRGEYEEAKKYLFNAKKFALKHNNLSALAIININLMLASFSLGLTDEGMQYATEAEGIYRHYADFNGLAQLYAKLSGQVHYAMGASTASVYCEKGLEFARAAGAVRLEHAFLERLGVIARSRGDFAAAFKYADESYDLGVRVLKISPHGALLTRAVASILAGHFANALDFAFEARGAAAQTGDPRIVNSVRVWICFIALYTGKLDLAIEQLGEMEKLLPKLQAIQRYNYLYAAARVWPDLGRIERAAGIFDKMHEEIREIKMDLVHAGLSMMLGRIETARYNFRKAESEFRTAHNLINPDVNFDTYIELLEAEVEFYLNQSNVEKARKKIEELEKELASLPNESPFHRTWLRLYRSRLALLEGDTQSAYNESMSGFLEAKGAGFRQMEVELAKIAAETSRDKKESDGLKKDVRRQVLEMVANLGDELKIPVQEYLLSPPRESIPLKLLEGKSSASRDSTGNLLRLAVFLARENNPQRAIEAILDIVFHTMDAKRAFLVIQGGEGLSISGSRYASGRTPEGVEREVSKSVIRHVIETGSPIFSDNLREESVFSESQSVLDLELLSILAIPVRISGEVRGCLYLDNDEKAAAFSTADGDHSQYLASLAGAVLERQMHIQHVERTSESLSSRLEKQSAEFEIIKRELDETKQTRNIDKLVGQSPTIKKLKDSLRRTAMIDLPVLLQGEVGTGKNLAARILHDISACTGRFVVVDCGAITESLFQAELFGVEKGAFTGADETKPGLLEIADKGTIFLDEIADLPALAQKSLLRVLAEGTIRRVGGREPIAVNIRVISSSNRDASELSEQDSFRNDLLYRLNAIQIELPPLRDRVGDIPLLAANFLKQIAAEHGGEVKPLSLDSIKALESYPWPGNIRELRNTLERAYIAADEKIMPEHLELSEESPYGGSQLSRDREILSLEEIEREHILRVLKANEGKIVAAARDLKIDRNRLRRKLEKYRKKGYY
ncbi:MAG: GAF domain-containing protein [Planctomycetota bacterium]|nr:MAG: GAF domain-containing protein [Planctomycetota bacterium]